MGQQGKQAAIGRPGLIAPVKRDSICSYMHRLEPYG